jgi:hypothetical protein
MSAEAPHCALPHTDSRRVGAGDFYFIINATFRFIEKRFGREGLRRYWHALGSGYYAPVAAAWKHSGLQAVADYWRAFFDAEPGAEVQVEMAPDRVVLNVWVCPAIKHLRAHAREIVPCFCQHCYYVSEAVAAPAGLTVRVEGGNGACRQTVLLRNPALPPQDLAQITEAA